MKNSKVDRFGVQVILENLLGGHWTERHDFMEQEVATLCTYAGVPAERKLFGLFGHLLPQQALSRLQQNQQSQVLRPDLRLDLPPVSIKEVVTRPVLPRVRGRP